MNTKKILSEGRVEEFKEKNRNKFSEEELNRIVSMVLPKYLNWVGSKLSRVNFDDNFTKIVQLLNKFEKISSNLPKTDINEYQSMDEIYKSIEEYENRQRREVKQVPGGNVVYEDGRFFVVNPLTHESSCYYGKGTKWCTAANTDDNFQRYNDDGKLFYVLDTQLPTSNPYYKVAILKKFDGETIYWDAKDDPIRNGWILETDKNSEINYAINSYMEDYFSEQLKIFRDKELARKERARVEALRIRRLNDTRSAEMEELRSTDAWNLSNPEIDSTGLKANALFDYLVDTGDIEALDSEDRARVREINQQIEELNQEYEASEDPRPELLDRVEELETELEEYEGKIDIYHLYPEGNHYELTRFIVIDSDNNNEYAVGTTSELEDSAEQYVESLIDDIGYDGFSKGFAENYIDTERILDSARDDYHYDVYEYPDSYLDDSQRELSREQEEKIKKNENEIEKLRALTVKLEKYIDGIEDEDIISEYEEKIEDYEERIDDLEIEVEEIKDSPEGDFPDELLDQKVDELVREVESDPLWYVRDRGMEINDFINKEDFIQGVIDADGLGIVNGYNGSYDEFKVKGEYYAVMRIN